MSRNPRPILRHDDPVRITSQKSANHGRVGTVVRVIAGLRSRGGRALVNVNGQNLIFNLRSLEPVKDTNMIQESKNKNSVLREYKILLGVRKYEFLDLSIESQRAETWEADRNQLLYRAGTNALTPTDMSRYFLGVIDIDVSPSKPVEQQVHEFLNSRNGNVMGELPQDQLHKYTFYVVSPNGSPIQSFEEEPRIMKKDVININDIQENYSTEAKQSVRGLDDEYYIR